MPDEKVIGSVQMWAERSGARQSKPKAMIEILDTRSHLIKAPVSGRSLHAIRHTPEWTLQFEISERMRQRAREMACGAPKYSVCWLQSDAKLTVAKQRSRVSSVIDVVVQPHLIDVPFLLEQNARLGRVPTLIRNSFVEIHAFAAIEQRVSLNDQVGPHKGKRPRTAARSHIVPISLDVGRS